MTRNDDPHDLLAAARQGDRRAIARLLTRLERDGRRDGAASAVAALPAGDRTGTWVIGVTGPPGVGKSTLVAGLVAALRGRGQTVAVLAVDPSSVRTGGSLLGDRIRMADLHGDDGVYIRSMAAGDHLGGLSAVTPQAVDLLTVIGFDVVVVETVGVGQSELDVADLADTTLVVVAPGAGDAVQAAKAGILEVADVLVVNKADQPGAGQVEQSLIGMLEIGHAAGIAPQQAPPAIVRTVAVRDEGIAELLDAADASRRARSPESQGLAARRRICRVIESVVADQVREAIATDAADGGSDGLVARVLAGHLTPQQASQHLLGRLAASTVTHPDADRPASG